MDIQKIKKLVTKNKPNVDITMLELAYEFAHEAHLGQKRLTGEDYIQHSLHTAYTLAEIKSELPTIIAGLLHDVPEDTKRNLDDIEKDFGSEIRFLVEGITKLSNIKYRGVERQRESLRKMFMAMARDLRVIIIKFADRLHNLRTIEAHREDKKIRIAQETLEIYVPIAGLLGMWRLKWQMEDICFKYLFPEDFRKLEYKYEIEKKTERNQFIAKVKKQLGEKLDQEKLNYIIEGRFKHLYSIYQKMQRKNRKFHEIYDVFALRIIVDTIADCYRVMGIIHSIWKPKTSRIKDYIAMPKPNGYQSLHTTVFGPDGKATEFQIRTYRMHEEALHGIAAHWHYKEMNNNNQPKWIQEILDIQKEAQDTNDFIRKLKLNVFSDRIFVFSPKGEVFELSADATPIDYAYHIHTDIGHKATGAVINNRMSTLDQKLKNGDMIEIITNQSRKGPNKNWLKFVKGRTARNKIKQYFKRSTLESIRKLISRGK